MKKFKSCKRLLSFVLSFCMALSMIPNLTVSASSTSACYANRFTVKITLGNQTKTFNAIEGINPKNQSATMYLDVDELSELRIDYSQPNTSNPVIGSFKNFQEPTFKDEFYNSYTYKTITITNQYKQHNAANGYAALILKPYSYGNYPLSIKLGGSMNNGNFVGVDREITLNLIVKQQGTPESSTTHTISPGEKTLTPSLYYKADRYNFSWTKKGDNTVLSTASSYKVNGVTGEEYICTIKGKDLTSTMGWSGTTQSWTSTYKVLGYDLTPPTPISGLTYNGKAQKLFTDGKVNENYNLGYTYYGYDGFFTLGYDQLWTLKSYVDVGTYKFTYYVQEGSFPYYSTVYSKTITCSIEPAPVDIVWPTFKTITLGEKLSTSHLQGGSAKFNGTDVIGSFSISGNTNWSYGGKKTVTVTFNPGSKNFKSASTQLSVNVTCTHPESQVHYEYNNDSTHKKICACGWSTNVAHIDNIKANCLEVAHCDVCNRDYGSVNPNNHISDDVTNKFIDENTHGIYYNCCGALKVSEAHNIDKVATCTDQKHCSVCDSTFGETNGENHTGELVWSIDNNRHIKKWTCCGATEGVQEIHTPSFKINEDGTEISADCSVCGHYLGTCSIGFDDDGIEYDGKKHTAYIDGYIYCTYGNNNLTLSYWQNGEKLNIKYNSGIANAGTYTIRLSTADNSYCIEKEVTIKKRELTINSILVNSKPYDGNNIVNAYDVHFNNVVYGEEVFCGIDGVTVVSGNTVGNYETVTGIESITPFVSYIQSYAGDNYYVTVDPTAEYPIADGGCYIYQRTLNITAHNQSITNGEEIDQTAYTLDNLPDGYEISGIKLETNEYDNVIDVNPYDAVITLNGEDVTENFDYYTYSGILEVVCQNHSFDSNGFCLTGDCDVYQTPEFILDEFDMKTYIITNAGELYFYANQVNTYGLSDINAILANDIVIPTTVSQGGSIPDWTPINNLYADFDGNGYSISGLYVDSDNNYVGLFGNHGYYEVKNLTIKDSYFKGNSYVGAIAGYSEGNYKNCAVMDDVTVIGTICVGGMLGENLGSTTITNCMSLADVQGDKFTGGLVGSNYTSIYNCYTNADKLVGTHSNYYGAEITYSYYLADEETDEFDGTTAVSSDDFTSGKLAYILQEKVLGEEIYDENLDEMVTLDPAQVWGQNLGVDEYPMISNYKVYYGYKDCMATEKIYDNFPLSNKIPEHTHEFADIDLDNRVTILDATALAKALAGITTLTDCQYSVADVNNDGMVNINDVTYIQMMLADLV